MFSSVDFPHPDGPTSETNSAASTARSTCASASTVFSARTNRLETS